MITKKELEKKYVKYFIILMGKISSQENYVKVDIGKCCSTTYLVPIFRFDCQTYEGNVCVWAGGGAKRQDWSGGYWNQNNQAVFCLRKKNSVKG